MRGQIGWAYHDIRYFFSCLPRWLRWLIVISQVFYVLGKEWASSGFSDSNEKWLETSSSQYIRPFMLAKKVILKSPSFIYFHFGYIFTKNDFNNECLDFLEKVWEISRSHFFSWVVFVRSLVYQFTLISKVVKKRKEWKGKSFSKDVSVNNSLQNVICFDNF